MADYRRWRVAGGIYFFTVVTHDRRPFLTHPLARRPFRIDAIVLLPDHVHTIWTLPPGDHDYATRWQLIKRRFPKTYLAVGGTEGSRSASRESKAERGIWQRRYFEHTCRDDDLKRCADCPYSCPATERKPAIRARTD
jgi:putative transposase